MTFEKIRAAIELIGAAKRPVFYTGGGVINAGPHASELLRELVRLTGFPITSTLMGTRRLSGFPTGSSSACWACTAPMRANLAMHGCDLMICIGARFDDRITGRLDAFSPELAQDPHRC